MVNYKSSLYKVISLAMLSSWLRVGAICQKTSFASPADEKQDTPLVV